MNYCPECGNAVVLSSTTEDITTEHLLYGCKECRSMWEETIAKSGIGETLHICPVKEGGD